METQLYEKLSLNNGIDISKEKKPPIDVKAIIEKNTEDAVLYSASHRWNEAEGDPYLRKKAIKQIAATIKKIQDQGQ